MLLQFKFKNYKCFYEETILDLMATQEKRHLETTTNINGNHILPVIAIHGANAAGKSSVLEALEYMFYIIKNSNRFDVNTRVRLIKESIKCFNNVSVDYFNGLTVEYAKMHNAVALIRGIRVSSDFEYEWELAAANEYIDPEVEMVFLMSHKENTFISSSAINELFLNGVDISPLVPKVVLEEYLKNS